MQGMQWGCKRGKRGQRNDAARAHRQVLGPKGELGRRAGGGVVVQRLQQAAGHVGALGVRALQHDARVDALADHVEHRAALGRARHPAIQTP